jgi:xanthine dehydrogenase accessory factor
MHVYDVLARARARGETVVLVTVLDLIGDPPSTVGAKLVVDAAGIRTGTLGCSELDTAAAGLAEEALTSGQAVRRRLDLAGHGQERGVEVFAEVHLPQPAVLVFGSTSVGRAVAAIARLLGRRVTVVAPGGDTDVPGGVEVRADEPGRYLLAAPPGPRDAVVVSDHDAPWVDEVLRICLASEAFFVGMLGSRRHAPAAVERLRAAGTPDAHLARLHSPCGLDIGSRSPEEIALSIVAEIVAVERGRSGGPLGLDWAFPSS